MITQTAVEIDAPPATVWAVYSDVARWPEWTASVRRVEALDAAPLRVGHRYRIDQPRLPALVWEVIELQPGASWRWRQRSPGGLAVAWHEVAEAPNGAGSHVRLGIEQRGPLGSLAGLLSARLTRRYLDLESRGLKARAEAIARGDVPSPPAGDSEA